MNWDWNYAYSVVAFVVGALAGFQAIYERYGDESGTSVNTLPGYGYLLSRGLVPVLSSAPVLILTTLQSLSKDISVGTRRTASRTIRWRFAAILVLINCRNSFWYQSSKLKNPINVFSVARAPFEDFDDLT